MPQSLARVHLHLVFSTRHREPWLQDDVREALHAYMSATSANAGCPVKAINSVDDHVHVLFELSRTMAVCDTVEARAREAVSEVTRVVDGEAKPTK